MGTNHLMGCGAVNDVSGLKYGAGQEREGELQLVTWARVPGIAGHIICQHQNYITEGRMHCTLFAYIHIQCKCFMSIEHRI